MCSSDLQVEIITFRERKGDIYSGWKKEMIVFFLDDHAEQFDTVDQAYVAYMEKVCGIGAKK